MVYWEVFNIDSVNVNVNPAAPAAPQKQKNPFLSAIGSFFIPGLGQVYNGEGILKGLLYLIGVFIGSLILVLPGLAIWIYGIYNAYKVSQKINLGQIPYKDVSLFKIVGYIVLYCVIWFAVIVVIVIFSAIIMALVFGTAGTTTDYSGY